MNKQFPILYKKDSKGKILEWKIEVQNNSGQIDIMMSYGELDGAKALRWQRDIKGKNVGKANETNSWEQAIKDVEGKILRKTREGYKDLELIVNSSDLIFEDVSIDINTLKGEKLKTFLTNFLPKDNTNKEGNILPMKAQQYYRGKKDWIDPKGKKWKDRKYYYLINPYVNKEKGAIITKFPCLIQPKINGVRCFAMLVDNKVKLFSKKGIEYNIPQVEDFLNINSDIFLDGDRELVLDGELYIHNEKLENITSAVKKVNLNTQRIKYIVFDLAIEELGTLDRRKLLKSKLELALKEHINPPLEIISCFKVSSDNVVQRITDNFIQDGYEGSILRAIDSEYAFGKRPQSMTKLKRVIDEEFTIIDIIPQDKNPELGLYVCKTSDGKEFKVNPTGDEDFKYILLAKKHEYIGKELTCWFYEYTEQGIPFHVVDTLIRDYE